MYISEISNNNNNTFSNETAFSLLRRAGDMLPHDYDNINNSSNNNNNTFSNETALGLLRRAGDKLPHAGRRIVASFEPVSCTVALVTLAEGELCLVITDIVCTSNRITSGMVLV